MRSVSLLHPEEPGESCGRVDAIGASVVSSADLEPNYFNGKVVIAADNMIDDKATKILRSFSFGGRKEAVVSDCARSRAGTFDLPVFNYHNLAKKIQLIIAKSSKGW
jgi:hypothetical protein